VVKIRLTTAKHSVSKKSEIFADVASAEQRTALLKNIGNLNFQLKTSPDFRAVCSSLSKFGLSKNETKVFVYLAKFGEQKAHKISRALSLHRTETYKILKRLEGKSLVYRILEKPMKFAGVPVGKALENLVQEEKQRVRRLEEEKEKVLNSWEEFSVPVRDPEALDEFIQVLKGRSQIYIKINEVVEEAEDEILIAASDEILLQMFYSGALDDLAGKSGKVNVRLLTDSSLRSSYIIKKLKLEEGEFLRVDYEDLPSFVVSNEHLLLFLNAEKSNIRNGGRALWTNQRDIVNVLKASFFSFNGQRTAAKAAS